MKTKVYHLAVLCLMIFFSEGVRGQTTFQKTYGSGFLGGTNAPNIVTVGKTFDGGYFFAGTTNAYAGDFYLMKLNFQGDTLWTKTYGGGV